DEVPLAERGEDQHRRLLVRGDLTGGRQPVHPRHLHVEDGEVGLVLLHQLHRLVTASRLPHDLVALLLEGLLQVQADDGFVFGDHDTDGHVVSSSRGASLRQRDSAASRSSSSSCRRSSCSIVCCTSDRWRPYASAWRCASWWSRSASGVSDTRARRRASSAASLKWASCSSVTRSSARSCFNRSPTSTRRRSSIARDMPRSLGAEHPRTGRGCTRPR